MDVLRKSGEEIIIKGIDLLDIQTMGSHRTSADLLDPDFVSGALEATERSWDRYEYLFGDIKTAAIYVLQNSPTQKAWEELKNISTGVANLTQLTSLINSRGFKTKKLLSYFETLENKPTPKYYSFEPSSLILGEELHFRHASLSQSNQDNIGSSSWYASARKYYKVAQKNFYSSLQARLQ